MSENALPKKSHKNRYLIAAALVAGSGYLALQAVKSAARAGAAEAFIECAKHGKFVIDIPGYDLVKTTLE